MKVINSAYNEIKNEEVKKDVRAIIERLKEIVEFVNDKKTDLKEVAYQTHKLEIFVSRDFIRISAKMDDGRMSDIIDYSVSWDRAKVVIKRFKEYKEEIERMIEKLLSVYKEAYYKMEDLNKKIAFETYKLSDIGIIDKYNIRLSTYTFRIQENNEKWAIYLSEISSGKGMCICGGDFKLEYLNAVEKVIEEYNKMFQEIADRLKTVKKLLSMVITFDDSKEKEISFTIKNDKNKVMLSYREELSINGRQSEVVLETFDQVKFNERSIAVSDDKIKVCGLYNKEVINELKHQLDKIFKEKEMFKAFQKLYLSI